MALNDTPGPGASAPASDGRSRRRIQAMRRVQAAALNLMEQKGYEGVTVEEIAVAAGVGPATVYRNFGTKERVVLWDEYDPMLLSVLSAQLRRQPLREAVLAALVDALEPVYAADAEHILRRARLILRQPQLLAASAADGAALRRGLSALLLSDGAVRGELEADAVAGAIVAALQGAVEHWVRDSAAAPLRHYLARALGALGLFAPRVGDG